MSSHRFGKGIGFLLGFAALTLSACAGSSSFMKPATERVPVAKDKALVRFMRPSSFGFGINVNVLDGDRTIGNSVAKSQFDYVAEPGRHLFVASTENEDYLEADLAAGRTYYVYTNIYPGVWRARVAFQPVTRGSDQWDPVLKYENELQILVPDQAMLKTWQDTHDQEAKGFVSAYENELKKNGGYPKLAADDGR